MQLSLERVFLTTTVMLLAMTAALKLASVGGRDALLGLYDPVIPFFTNRQLLALTAVVEIGYAIAIWKHRNTSFGFILVGSLSLTFLAYRMGLSLVGHQGNCSCLGHPGRWLFSREQDLRLVANAVLIFLLSGFGIWLGSQGWKLTLQRKGIAPRLLVLILIQMGSMETALLADYVKIDFTITGSLFRRDGQKTVEKKYYYQVFMGTNRWFINELYGTNYYRQHYCNGTNIFSVLYDPKVGTNGAPGVITTDDYPSRYDYPVTLPWLAFCSGQYLNSERASLLPNPWFIASSDPMAHITGSEVGLSQGGTPVPKYVTFSISKARARQANRSSYLDREVIDDKQRLGRLSDYSLMFPSGPKLFEYEALELLTTNQFVLPAVFSAKAFAIDSAIFLANKAQLMSGGFSNNPPEGLTYVVASFEGRISRVAYFSENLMPPRIKYPTSVFDCRLRDDHRSIDGVNYFVTDHRWHEGISRKMQELLKEKQAKADRLSFSVRKKQALVGVCISILILFPLALAYWNKKKQLKPLN